MKKKQTKYANSSLGQVPLITLATSRQPGRDTATIAGHLTAGATDV